MWFSPLYFYGSNLSLCPENVLTQRQGSIAALRDNFLLFSSIITYVNLILSLHVTESPVTGIIQDVKLKRQ